MQTFEIRRIRSNAEADYAWVTLWFRTDARVLSPLHIACQRTSRGGRYAKYDALYLERDDQSAACYGGADEVLVNAVGIKFKLNRAGVKNLKFERSVTLLACDGLSGWTKARRILGEMAGYPTGGALRLA